MPHLAFGFDSLIMASKLTANRTAVVDDRESTSRTGPSRYLFPLPAFLYCFAIARARRSKRQCAYQWCMCARVCVYVRHKIKYRVKSAYLRVGSGIVHFRREFYFDAQNECLKHFEAADFRPPRDP